MAQQFGANHNFDNIYVILVNPQMGENIGSVARIMHNFALSNIRIVNPRDGWPSDKALAMSAGAKNLINNAEIFSNFQEAIQDLSLLFATTARIREMNKQVVDPEKAATIINSNLNNKIGIVIGQESSGLCNEDVVKCNMIITIPVNDNYKSINIAQALGIICYEIFKHKNKDQENSNIKELASSNEILNLFEHLESELDKRNFFRVSHKKNNMIGNLRNIFMRINNFTSQDVLTLRGVIKSLSSNKIIK